MGGRQLRLRIEPTAEEDSGDLPGPTRRLRRELLKLDVVAVHHVDDADFPEEAKGLGTVAGWLVVWLGPAGLGAVLHRVGDWAGRNGRVVEVSMGGESLKLGRATAEQQDRLVDAFVARHSSGP